MMTLEQVRDVLINEAEWYESRLGDYKTPDFRAMADAIDAHLSQPQPVAQGEAVTGEAVAEIARNGDEFVVSWLIEGGIDAMIEGEVLYILGMKCPEDGAVELFATPTIPTGHRVVEVDAVRWDKVRKAFDGMKTSASEAFLWSLRNGGINVGDDVCKSLDELIDAASPSAGGV